MTTHRILIATFLLFLFSPGFSQEESSIYSNSFEEELFAKLVDSAEISSLDLFIAAEYSEGAQVAEERIDKLVTRLNEMLARQTKMKKRLGIIYKEVHNEFFKKYEEKVRFKDIFKTGTYNCVTASALYALVLDRLEIDYIIKQTPQHVYLIADPGETSYLFESTRPSDGVVQYDSRYQQAFVDYLHKNKIISDTEYNNEPISILFIKYFSDDISISLVNLAGIQYYNEGIFFFEGEKYDESMKSLMKAIKLYPESNTIKYTLNAVSAVVLDREYKGKNYNPATLRQFLELNRNDESTMQNGVNYFNDISVKMVVEQSRYNAYKKYFASLNEGDLDSAIRSQLEDKYYSMLSYYHYMNDEYSEALHYMAKAFEINPRNLESRQRVKELTAKRLIEMKPSEQMLDTIETYISQFPFLASDKNINVLQVYCISSLVNQSFMDNDVKKGRMYLEKLEFIAKNNPQLAQMEDDIAVTYAQAASYFIREKKYARAEEILRRGMTLAPNSYDLKSRMKSLREFNATFGKKSNSAEALKVYNEALKKAQQSNDLIVKNFYKHGMRKWTTFKVIDGPDMYDVAPGEEFDFELKANRRTNITVFRQMLKGNWVFNENNCTLTFNVEGDYTRVNILITEIDENKIAGIIFFDGDHANSYRIFLKADG